MIDLVEMLQKEQGRQSPETFANKIGIKYGSLYAYYRGTKSLGAKNAKIMAHHFAEKGEWDKVYMIASTLLDLDLPRPKNGDNTAE